MTFSIISSAQWQNLTSGLDFEGKVLLYDSVDGKLYVGGNFLYAGSLLVHDIASWDGSQWDSLAGGAPYQGSPVYALEKFHGELYAASLFQIDQDGNYNCLSKWDGQSWQWDTLNQKINKVPLCFKAYNNEMYLGGTFTKIGSQRFNLLAKYDGQAFSSFLFPADSSDQIMAIEFYGGEMYIGGNFYDTLTGVNDLEVWDGNNFHPFGGNGLAFGGDYVSSMVVYNNELYIGGWFQTAFGDPGNSIMRWDGFQLRNVGAGMDLGIRKMHVYGGLLYACGTFTTAGGIPASGIAVWDGAQWSPVVPSFTFNGISDFAIIGNDIYLIGGFDTINSVHMNGITMYSGINAIETIYSETGFRIVSNPVSDIIRLSFQNQGNFKVRIVNLLGSVLHSEESYNNSCELDIQSLPAGIYFVQVETEMGNACKKFVKQ